MTWYAIRTVPGAQKPQREYEIEKTRSAKGYRVVPSLDPQVSAVEKALGARGFVYYMPAEKRLQRDRLRPFLWKSRRFALMVGYVFVRDPHNWTTLRETPGVAGIVANRDGQPLEISILEILTIRAAEAAAEVEFDKQSREARKRLRKAAKTDPGLKAIVDKLDIAGTISLPLDSEVLAA